MKQVGSRPGYTARLPRPRVPKTIGTKPTIFEIVLYVGPKNCDSVPNAKKAQWAVGYVGSDASGAWRASSRRAILKSPKLPQQEGPCTAPAPEI